MKVSALKVRALAVLIVSLLFVSATVVAATAARDPAQGSKATVKAHRPLPVGVTSAPTIQTIVGTPLTIIIGNDTSFQVINSSFPGNGQIYPGDCTADVADAGIFTVIGATLYSPDFDLHTCGTATFGIGTYAPWTPVSMSAVSGIGTAATPYRVTVVADAGATGVRLTAVYTYVDSDSVFRIAKTFSATSATTMNVYLGADIYLAGSDYGIPFLEPTASSPGGKDCLNTGYTELLVPTTPADRYTARDFGLVWLEIGAHGDLTNLVDPDCIDNGAALQWRRTLGPGGSTTILSALSFGPVVRNDYNGDGKADILLRDSGGNLGMWLMNGPVIASGAFVGSPGAYTVGGIGDFNGDGKADILLRDSGGNLGMWIMNGPVIASGAFVGSPGGSYTVAGVGDFNGGSKADILLRDSLGNLGMWIMNGPVIASGAFVGSPGGSYTVGGVGDFNGDGKADILLRDSLGNLGMWLMNGPVIASGAFVGSPGGSYTVAGVADFNGDGKADILLRDSLGNLGMWLMDGAVISSGAFVGSPGGYTVAATNDYNGDGKADILLRDSGGSLGMWIMNGPTVTSGAFVGSPGANSTAY
jgi:uncharacterized protein (DUF2141 family)